MQQNLEKLLQNGLQKISATKSVEELFQTEKDLLGKKGELGQILKGVKDLSDEEKRSIGKFSNDIKKELQEKIDKRRIELKKEEIETKLKEEWIDVTLPGKKPVSGHIHPISAIGHEVEHIFGQMGFSVMDGPEVESEYYNFEALNIPATHPARDMQDTFFLDKEPDKEHSHLVLRTHTSPVQIRSMLKYGAPLRLIVPGRVFRYEATDATHETTFNQVEGLLIDKEINLSHLKGVMAEFLSRLFGKEVKVRFRPGYFPFVEPGLELDFSCLLCDGAGCRTCKKTGWVEFMGSGMVHPNVLRAGGIDPNEYQGWAFGFGLTRLVMMRYKIDDIRYLTSGDLRFVNQF